MKIRWIAPAVVAIAAALGGCGGDETGSGGSGGGAGGDGAGGGAGGNGSGGSGGGSGGGSAMGACSEPVASDPDIAQELPKEYLDTTFAAPSGATIAVPEGGDLQAAINMAQPGDTITLAAGATYAGTITLPKKTGDGWIVIRTSTPDGELPAPGTRVSPSNAPLMAKITAPAGLPAIQTEAGAHHYRIIGLEIAPISNMVDVYTLVALGDTGQTSLDAVPHHIVLDRLYVHGFPDRYLKRGVELNSAHTAVIDSHVSDCHAEGQDAQAIAGFNGPGPFKIENNYLEGSGENVMFGGADPKIQDLVPSDIEITRNYFYKPLSWRVGDPSFAGHEWSVKNLFELKNARRVLVRCNVFENNWGHAQVGFAILFTVRNQDGSAPWSAVQDVTFIKNIVRHTASAINILGTDDLQQAQTTKRILIQDNFMEDVNGDTWNGSGRVYQMLSGAESIKVDHNTAFQSGTIMVADGAPSPGLVFTNNISPANTYGIHGSGQAPGNGSIMAFFPGSTFSKNVIPGAPEASYPAGNFYPATIDDVGFVNAAGGDYHLKSDSPYAKAATDGRDIGADIDAIQKGTAGVAP